MRPLFSFPWYNTFMTLPFHEGVVTNGNRIRKIYIIYITQHLKLKVINLSSLSSAIKVSKVVTRGLNVLFVDRVYGLHLFHFLL